MSAVSEATRRAVTPLVGAAAWVEVGGHGSSGVWRVGSHYVKQHPSRRKWEQEVRAYRGVVSALRAEGWRVPALLAADEESRSLVLSAVGGERTAPDTPAAHRAAGAFSAALHALPTPSDDSLPVGAAIRQRLDAVIRRLELPSKVIRGCRDATAGVGMDGVARRWCHRDFTAENWLMDGPNLGVIDFEHTRPDHPLVDAVKLWCGVWRRAPACRSAWEAGRGVPLDAAEREQLTVLAWLHGLGTLAWGQRHGDAASRSEGRHIVEWLLTGGEHA